ncbi:MAG TPA: hypothetical protein VJV79_36975 [Polyangiaceae bacterium]|nr:hypothetical protein [Polyangiaceae bacterium]
MTAPPAAQRPASSEFWSRLQRERALIALFDLGRQKSHGLRVARLYAFSVFAGYAIAIALTHGSQRGRVIHGFIEAALVSLSWVVGALAALGSAQALAEQPERDALSTLAQQRGFARTAVLRARTEAATVRVARLVGVPALLLVLVGVARGGTLPWALSVAPAVIAYAFILGLALALLAHFSAELSPRHPRLLLAALVLGPLLLSLAFPAIPSLPRLFSGLLSRLLAVGARLS